MNRWTGLALLFALPVLFLIANRGAYESYFSDDELDNISWAPHVRPAEYAQALLSPKFQPDNFRPVGHLYFALAGRAFGMDFPKYLIPIHLIHLLNVWLLWFVVRRLGGTPFAAGAAAVLFAFHMAVFDVYWKPMYAFDLLCATFCLAAMLLWIDGRWVLAFAAFWLAYKSKELAVMLPFVLGAYEFWLGKRQWKPLLPFAAVSFSFGIQGLLFNPHRTGDYGFKTGLRDVWKAASYYRDRVLLFPFGGLALAALPAVVRDRRVWFGVAALALFFVPLLPLSGRLFGAYCYVPLIGAAIALSGVADRGHRIAVAVFLLAWIPFNYMHLRLNRRQALALAAEHRGYVASLAAFARQEPDMRQFLYDGRPFALHPWGIQGALRSIYRSGEIRLAGIEDPEARAALEGREPVALLGWDPARAVLTIAARRPGAPDAPYLEMNRATPVWQLGEGWFQLENRYRWTKPVASARLHRPEGARRFALTVNVSPDMLRDAGGAEVRLVLDGEALPPRRFTAPGFVTAHWDLPPRPAGPAAVRLESKPYRPSNQDPRLLGAAVVAFGFIE